MGMCRHKGSLQNRNKVCDVYVGDCCCCQKDCWVSNPLCTPQCRLHLSAVGVCLMRIIYVCMCTVCRLHLMSELQSFMMPAQGCGRTCGVNTCIMVRIDFYSALWELHVSFTKVTSLHMVIGTFRIACP